MNQNSTQNFYDDLSGDYHLIFADWEKSILRQAGIIDNIFQKKGIPGRSSILDCSCGIGTQTLGLAQKGYMLTASDLSPVEIERAKNEAEKRKLVIEFYVSDFRELTKNIGGEFDVVISFDNSLPHLLDNESMISAIQNIFSQVKSGGYFIGSIRDYDEILKEKPLSTPANIKYTKNSKTISFQVWNWNQCVYELEHITLEESNGKYETRVRRVSYRAWQREELSQILLDNGFKSIDWFMPNETDYYQPIFIAKK